MPWRRAGALATFWVPCIAPGTRLLVYNCNMANPRVIKIIDLPECDPNISHSWVLAKGRNVVVIYDSKGTDWPDSDSWAVVRFDRCLTYQGGGPNDEALHNHPLYPSGLTFYSLQEVLDSPWLRAQATIADKSGDPSRLMQGQRHFAFAFKEELFECIAMSYSLVGLFDSAEMPLRRPAIPSVRVATDIVGDGRPGH